MKYGYNENGDKIYENIHGYYYNSIAPPLGYAKESL